MIKEYGLGDDVMNVLVTGGAGYIGSHTCIELLEAGHTVTVVDNLSNSSLESLKRVKEITGKEVVFHQVDLLDTAALDKVLASDSFDSVIHFAALKAVGESVEQPIRYYHNNVTGTLNLCEAMAKVGLKNIVFSSSATVYGTPKSLPLTEDADTPIEEVTNPYGRSKLMVEWALKDVHTSDGDWNIALLRYFNPVGAHKSGLIGEDPQGPPNNLMPYVSQVAVGKREKLSVYGDDYATPDGTGVRDYIHVVDLAKGHVKAIEKLASDPGVVIYNLGTGQGYSVLEMVKSFEEASGKDVPYQVTERRAGDIASCYADPEKAKTDLGWQAELGLQDMCEDSWRWQSQNPDGYKQAS